MAGRHGMMKNGQVKWSMAARCNFHIVLSRTVTSYQMLALIQNWSSYFTLLFNLWRDGRFSASLVGKTTRSSRLE